MAELNILSKEFVIHTCQKQKINFEGISFYNFPSTKASYSEPAIQKCSLMFLKEYHTLHYFVTLVTVHKNLSTISFHFNNNN